MKTSLLLFSALAWAVSSASAQQPTPSPSPSLPPLPPGALVDKLPNSSRWEVNYEYRFNAQPAPSGHDQPVPAPSLSSDKKKPGDGQDRKSVMTKQGNVFNEESLFGDGRKESRWYIDKLEIVYRTTSKIPAVNFGSKRKNEDFPGLGWVSRTNYVATEEVSGQKCYVFRDKVKITEQAKWQGLDYDGPPPQVNAVARVDMVSLLPVTVQIGEESRTFKYDPILTTPMAIPDSVREIINNINVQAKNTPPPRPRP